jgi:uncharacterized protein YgbK (DUF1537 family)
MAEGLSTTRDGSAEVLQLLTDVKRDNERLRGELDTARRAREDAVRQTAVMRRDRDAAEKLLAERDAELRGKSSLALFLLSALPYGS